MKRPVAVIDIGSNTIKLLVAARGAGGSVQAVASRTIDARISAGIGGAEPMLTDDGISRGVAAVEELHRLAVSHGAATIQLVATSAVRDAANGDAFRAHVLAATGASVRILSGDEEARYIGRGLTADPALSDLRHFQVFDLGGGSLECLTFVDREVTQAFSAQLGCVRLTERFITDPAVPLRPAEAAALSRHVRDCLVQHNFQPSAGAMGVFSGGSMTTVRAMAGAAAGLTLAETSPEISVDAVDALLTQVAPLHLSQRYSLAGLPASRADVFPAALLTILAVAELGGYPRFLHSFYNLRWGLAAHLLDVESGRT